MTSASSSSRRTPARLLIGLGTGRCGTVSLSQLLDAQPDVSMLHEGMIDGQHHLLRWHDDEARLDHWLGVLQQRAAGTEFFGDVGMYFLPYVGHLLARWPHARFIVLRRDREATVQSFLKKTEGRNHWMEHDGTTWAHDSRWDASFPTFDAPDKATALRQYWDTYYAEVERLQQVHPGSIATFEMGALNSEVGRAAILDHAGIPQDRRVLAGAFHQNRDTLWKRWLARLHEMRRSA